MAKESRRWRWWLTLAIGGIAVWQVVRYFTAHRSGTEKLLNQVWVERMPGNPRDMVWHFIALDHDGRHTGVLGRSSRWRVISDRLLWRQEGNRITLFTPQNRCRSTLEARTWKCAGEAPRPFELCLQLEGGGKRYRYYSRNDWGIRPNAPLDGDGDLAFAAPALQSALAPSTGDESAGDSAEECVLLDGPH